MHAQKFVFNSGDAVFMASEALRREFNFIDDALRSAQLLPPRRRLPYFTDLLKRLPRAQTTVQTRKVLLCNMQKARN